MINERHQNPIIEQRLKSLLLQGGENELIAYLKGLSNADFRTAGYLLGETLLLQWDAIVFWKLFRSLVNFAPKAFLVTLTKTACKRYRLGTLRLADEHMTLFIRDVVDEQRAIDQTKFINLFLPELKSPEEIELFLVDFHLNVVEKLAYLIRCSTIPANFVLFCMMKQIDCDKDLLRKYCILLKKRGDALSFNLASIANCYFDLHVPGTFSLNIRPYELNYLDVSYETFRKVLTSI